MDQQHEHNKGFLVLPNSTASLVLGIISIVGSFCLFGLGGLICGIIGLSIANKNRELYNKYPQLYSEASLNTSNAGRICSIIGIFFSFLFIALVAYNFYLGFSSPSYHHR
jgi:hypothetical protein